MICPMCGKRTDEGRSYVGYATVVGGSVVIESTILAGMVFTPFAVMGLLFLTWSLLATTEHCKCLV